MARLHLELFIQAIRPQRAVLRDLERTKQRYLAEDLEVYFDIVDASERIWDMVENFKEVIERSRTRTSRCSPTG
jgi:magnesium transporter